MTSTFRGADYYIVKNGSLTSVRKQPALASQGGGGGGESELSIAKRTGVARPFAENGPWNTPFTGSETWYDSATLRTVSPAEQSDLGQSTNERHWYWAETSVKVWWSTNADPLWTFQMPNYIYTPFNRNRSASTFTFHCPDNMVENQDADHILVVVNSDTGDMVEVWQAETTDSPLVEGLAQQGNWEKQTLAARTVVNRIFGGSIAPGWARSNIITDPGAGTTYPGGTNDGTRASNFSWLAGLLTERDFDNGEIDHAMVISLGYVTLNNTDWTAPATAPDNGGHSGPMWMGDRIGIPSDQVAPGTLSATGLMVWNCLQTYGAYVGDFAGSAYPIFYLDESMVATYDAELRHLFIWFDSYEPDMDIIIPYLRIANRNPGA